MPLHCLYVGDSDISRWPLSDQRKSSSVIYEPDLRLHLPTSRISKSGWTSFEVESHLRRQLEADPQSIRPKEGDYVVVACWGENDLSDCQAVNMASIKTTVNNTMEAIKVRQRAGDSSILPTSITYNPFRARFARASPLAASIWVHSPPLLRSQAGTLDVLGSARRRR